MGRRGIFICYRREDSRWAARALANELQVRFGDENVLMDVDTARIGNWRARINESLEASAVVVVLIGPQWLEQFEKRTEGRDEVRYEIAEAIRRGLILLPVTLGGTQLPERRLLPEDIAPLTDEEAYQLGEDKYWRPTLTVLIRDLEQALGTERAEDRDGEGAIEQVTRERETQIAAEAEQLAQRETEAKARREAQEQAQREADEPAQREADEQARRETVLEAVQTQPGATPPSRVASRSPARPPMTAPEHGSGVVFRRLRNRQPAGDRALTENAFERLVAASRAVEQRPELLTSAVFDGEPGLLAAFGDRLIFAWEAEDDTETIALAAIGSAVLESPSCIAIRIRVDRGSGPRRVRPYRVEISDSEDRAALQDLLQIAAPQQKVSGTNTPVQGPKPETGRETSTAKPGMKTNLWSKLGLQK